MYELELDDRCTALALSLFFAANLLTFHLPYTYVPTYFAKAQCSIWHKIYPESDNWETIFSKLVLHSNICLAEKRTKGSRNILLGLVHFTA